MIVNIRTTHSWLYSNNWTKFPIFIYCLNGMDHLTIVDPHLKTVSLGPVYTSNRKLTKLFWCCKRVMKYFYMFEIFLQLYFKKHYRAFIKSTMIIYKMFLLHMDCVSFFKKPRQVIFIDCSFVLFIHIFYFKNNF